MKLTKYDEWNCPENTHQAKIVDARLISISNSNNEEEVIRIIFELTSLVHPMKVYKARKIYKSKALYFFVKDFKEIVGEDVLAGFFTLNSELIPQALNALVRKEADIKIIHDDTKGYENPLCIVAEIKPRGALVHDLAEAY